MDTFPVESVMVQQSIQVKLIMCLIFVWTVFCNKHKQTRITLMGFVIFTICICVFQMFFFLSRLGTF